MRDEVPLKSAETTATIPEAVRLQMARILTQRVPAGLHIVATPIGNLGDFSLRAIATLAHCDVIYCEDTRRSRVLLDTYGIGRPLRAYHEHNADRERPYILARLAENQAIALISDAGTPLVSDPGYKLVRDVTEAGYGVTAVPGASAVLTGLAVSGLATDSFFFAGFLPPKEGARRQRLSEIATVPGTLVLFESPGRLAALLEDAATILGTDRPAAVARELTKLHESVVRGTLETLGATFADDAIGELVVLIGPPTAAPVDRGAARERLRSLLQSVSLKDATRVVADQFGLPRGEVYDLALSLKGERP